MNFWTYLQTQNSWMFYFIMWFTKLECPHNLRWDVRNCPFKVCLWFWRNCGNLNNWFPTLHFSSALPATSSSPQRPTTVLHCSTSCIPSVQVWTFSYLKRISNVQTFHNSPRRKIKQNLCTHHCATLVSLRQNIAIHVLLNWQNISWY